MSGFANQIIGGLSKLIRPAIQSPNYVPHSAGWTVNQDGSAEFNDGTFRGTVVIDTTGVALLVYNGTPAFQSLILAVAAAAGVDAYGNHYNNGLTFCTDYLNPAMSWLDAAGLFGSAFPYIRASLTNGLQIQGPSNAGAGVPAFIALENDSSVEIFMYNNGTTAQSIESHQDGLLVKAGGYTGFYLKADGSGFCFGTSNANNGLVGKALYQEGTIAGTVHTGTITNCGINVTVTNSDYGNCFNGSSQFIVPVTCPYDFTFMIAFSTGVGAEFILEIQDITAGIPVLRSGPTVADSSLSLSGTRYCTAGHALQFIVYQASGSDKIAVAPSFASVRRSLI